MTVTTLNIGTHAAPIVVGMNSESEAERERRYAREDHERAMERARADEIAHRQAMERMQMMSMAQHSANTQANVAQTGMTAMGTSNPGVVVVSAPAPTVYGTERYCGPISWIIGILVFPCICCCPIDERPVYAGAVAPAPMYVQAQPPMLAPAPSAPTQYQQQPMSRQSDQPYYGMPMQGIPAAKPV
jgi:hypothetical protein